MIRIFILFCTAIIAPLSIGIWAQVNYIDMPMNLVCLGFLAIAAIASPFFFPEEAYRGCKKAVAAIKENW